MKHFCPPLPVSLLTLLRSTHHHIMIRGRRRRHSLPSAAGSALLSATPLLPRPPSKPEGPGGDLHHPKSQARPRPEDLLATTPVHLESRPSLLSAVSFLGSELRFSLAGEMVSFSLTASVFASHPLSLPLLLQEAPPQNFRGLLTLQAIILIAMTARLVLENVVKYGWLLTLRRPNGGSEGASLLLPPLHFLWIFLSLLLAPLEAHLIEVCAAERFLSHSQAFTLHLSLVALQVVGLPIVIILASPPSILWSLGLLLAAVVLSLKLFSLAHVCNELRKRRGSDHGKQQGMAYQPNLLHVLYFMAAPTLIFQTSYPRSTRIRRRFVLRRLLELLFCFGLQVFLFEQYVIPTIHNSITHIDEGDLPFILERMLKLAVPNTLIWLLFFYGFFHCYLNLVAEVLRFGDRCFYLDWWNAETLGDFWRSWNIPVHNWVVMNLYAPLRRRKVKPGHALLLAFTVSAVIHEALVSIPTQRFRLWFFGLMLAQGPVIWATRLLLGKGTQKQGEKLAGKVCSECGAGGGSRSGTNRTSRGLLGNAVFWVTFLVFGQPLMILMYSYDIIKHSSSNTS